MGRRIVVIGGGECGTRAALALRACGFDGPISVVDSDPFAPYERPPLSKAALGDATAGPPGGGVLGSLRSASIEFVYGRIEAIDRRAGRVLFEGRREMSYDRLLIATGARASSLSVPGGEHALRLRTWQDVLRLRDQLQPGMTAVVIGGGFLGLEIAACAALRGCSVTVLEQAFHVLERLVPASIASVVAARHRRERVDIRCGARVAAVRRAGRRFAVEVHDSDAFVADVVIAAVGARPNTDLAGAAGLRTEAGIVVDSRFATSDGAIFAAGDCCSFPLPFADGARLRLESWRNAVDHGDAAALALLGASRPYTAVPWFWSDQYDLTLQIAGVPSLGAREVLRVREDGVEIRFDLASDGRLVSASAIGEGDSVAKDIRLAVLAIGRGSCPSSVDLADPARPLRAVLLNDGAHARRNDEAQRIRR
ncbi:MAG TPA: FAD-dependent oxidoreductase [Gaiellaceae bacterium]|nr:FAD-dependent oxidoreductase [Gaiellaceae bacterium]